MSVARALSPESLTELTRALDLSGVVANGTLGGVLARASRLDLFGFLVMASSRAWAAESSATPCCSTAPPWP
ncbi:hypothetical protein ACWCV9_12135 [Streptomyces sp. NPDC001606]